MLEANIESITEELDLALQQRYLNVKVLVLQDGEQIDTRFFGYPLGTTEEQVSQEVKNFLTEYQREVDNRLMEEQGIADQQNAEQVVTNLTGKTFSITLEEKVHLNEQTVTPDAEG